MSSRVFITGFGIISSIGKNANENFQSLVNQRTGYGELEVVETVHRQTLRSCEVKLSDDELCSLAGIKPFQGYTRTSLLGLVALEEALRTSGLSREQVASSGLISATTTGGIREFEKYYNELLDPHAKGDFLQFIDTANPGEHTERLADHLDIRRYLGTISTACSSSANALMMGAQLIKNQKLDRVICGGAEALSKFTLNGFNSLMILDAQSCRPFDATRSGLNLGEGAAYLVLESADEVARRKATPLAELKGYGNANDAFHQTASSPDGAGALKAMQLALQMANVDEREVDYINAHGTATENNDLSEGLAMQKLFDGHPPDFSSTKPYTGHTLAAAGSIEAAFCIMALQHQSLFPNLNYQHQMPELTITPLKELKLVSRLRYVLSNSFGFGGNTSSLLIARV